MELIRSHIGKMQLWPVEHFYHHKRVPVVLQVPFCDEKQNVVENPSAIYNGVVDHLGLCQFKTEKMSFICISNWIGP